MERTGFRIQIFTAPKVPIRCGCKHMKMNGIKLKIRAGKIEAIDVYLPIQIGPYYLSDLKIKKQNNSYGRNK